MHRTTWISALLLVVFGSSITSAAPPVPPLSDLTPAHRQRADQLAAGYPRDDAKEHIDNFANNPTAWLIGQASLTDEEEAELAKKAHDLLLKNTKTVAVPKDVDQLFQKLLGALPSQFKPQEYRFTLTILDANEIAAFSVGAGYVYVTRPLLEALLTGKERGMNALAFVLAHELALNARQHCRRGYQLQLIQEEIKNGLVLGIKEDLLKDICKTNLAPAGELAKFVYNNVQEDEADLFGLHLCRNAGLDLDGCLDFLRWAVVLEHPKVLTDPAFQPDPKADRSKLPFYLSSHPPALRRLKRMTMELTGGVDEPAKYGLFVFDRANGKVEKAANGAVAKGTSALVFVHGMHGDENGLKPMMTVAGERADLKNVKLLFFRYPNNQSLARAGELLSREMARVVASPEMASFVGHSAGGLAIRWYVERKKGAFERAVFVATPHDGSSLTRLKILLDAGTYWDRIFKTDLLEATRETLAEGVGEMGLDLEPDSLFLRFLESPPKMADRYSVFFGNVRKRAGFVPFDSIAGLATALKLSRPVLKQQVTGAMTSAVLKHLTGGVIDQLVVPPEILNGDLVVSVSSAKLKGAKQTIETDQDHLGIIRDKAVIDKILDVATGR